MNVCTHHVPNVGYGVDVKFGPLTYIFAPQAYWDRKGIITDADMRMNMCDRRPSVGEARDIFAEFVADTPFLDAMWEAYGSPSDIADRMIVVAKSAKKEREAVASGAVSMF